MYTNTEVTLYAWNKSAKTHTRYALGRVFFGTTAKVLEIYRCRDVIDKSLKNDLDMRRLYMRSNEAADRKLFCVSYVRI